MSIRKATLWGTTCLITALAFPAKLTADPVTVTGGYLLVTGSSGSLELTGERGFSLSAEVSTFSGVFAPNLCDTPDCAPGTTLGLHATWVGLDVRRGVLTFEGETYPLRDDAAAVGLDFRGSFIAPPIARSAVVRAPFILPPRTAGTSGGSGFSLPFPGPSFALQGGGTATISLSQYFENSPEGSRFLNAWTVESVRYDFSAAEPVPEPGTLLLAAVGIAGIARRATRRRG